MAEQERQPLPDPFSLWPKGKAVLQESTNGIYEISTTGGYVPTTTSVDLGFIQTTGQWWPNSNTVYWNNYPVYVTTDKTKKAIEVLKALQAEKLLDCKSVPRFIELVEKISGIL